MSTDLGLLIVRLLIGGLFVGHGAQKVFGLFGGPGLDGTTGWLGSIGFRPARFWAYLAGFGEFGGGTLLALGLLNPLGPLAIIGAMLIAIIKVHSPNGLWVTKGGIEYPLVLAVLSGIVGLLGSGRYALDAALGFNPPEPTFFWIGLVLTVAVSGVGLVISNQRTRVSAQH